MSSILNATTSSGLQIAPDNSGSLQLQTNNGTTALTIDTSQNVGIGTTSPNTKLDITSTSTTNIQLATIGSSAAGAGESWTYLNLRKDNAGSSTNFYGGAIGGYLSQGVGSGLGLFTYNGSTTPAERMRIDSSGNVNIGTAGSGGISYKLQVNQTFGNSFASSLGATAAGTANNQLAGISFSPTFANTVDYAPRRAADIWSGFNAGSWGTQYLAFGVGNAANDAGNATTERMRIDSNGNLLFNSGYGSVATAYGCRAWIKFNGTGTVAINGSGNVSSITDNGTGLYTINFTTAMTDTNYSVGGFASNNDDGANESYVVSRNNTSTYTTSACQITTTENTSSVTTRTDCPLICVQIFR